MKDKFIIPEAIIILFDNEDVIATSGLGGWYGEPGDDGYDED